MQTEYKVGDHVTCMIRWFGDEKIIDGEIIVIKKKLFRTYCLVKEANSKFAEWVETSRILKKI